MHRIALLALAVALAGCKAAERPPTPITGKVTLRYHPPAGAVYRYVMEQNSRFGQDSSADSGAPNTMRITFTQKVGAADASGVPVTMTFDSAHVESPMLNPAAADQAAERLREVHVTIVYDDHLRPVHNDVSSLSGVSPLVRDQIQVGFRAAALALPDQPVGTGDSWTNETDLPVSAVGGVPLTVHTKITVREISVSGTDTTVRLGVETELPAAPLKFSFSGQPFTVGLKGAITGEQTLSLTRGAVVQADLGGTMHVNVSGGFFGPQGMLMRVQQQGTLKLVS